MRAIPTCAKLVLLVLVALALPVLSLPRAAGPALTRLSADVQAVGDVSQERGLFTVKSATATLILGAADGDNYRVSAELKMADRAGGPTVQMMPADVHDVNRRAALYGYVSRGADGLSLQTSTYLWDRGTGKWDSKADALWYTYWPAATDKARLAQLADSKLAPRNLARHWLRLRFDAEQRQVAWWLDGLLVRQLDRPAGLKGPVVLQLRQGDQVRGVRIEALAGESLFLPVDLGPFVNDRFARPADRTRLTGGGVPFELADATGHINLRPAGWIEVKKDPADYYENYEGGPPIVHDPRMPLVRVPVADYVAAHLLAVADDDPATTNNLTLRAGRYGSSEQVVFHSFPGSVPRRREADRIAAAGKVSTPAGPLFHVRVPMTEAFAQDIERFIEIELTKEVRLARRQPDPCRFRSRPLGLPSGVRIAALTLERSPLQMHVGSKEKGHAFVEPERPTFAVTLKNITSAEQPYQLTLTATPLDGAPVRVERKGRVGGGETAIVSAAVPVRKRGYYDLAVALRDGAGRLLLERRTSFALLPGDTRRYRATSPFGTWDFCGGHFTSNDPDTVGPLYVKLGLRYGMSGFAEAKRKHYGILPGTEPNIYAGGLKDFRAHLKTHPDSPLIGLIFHETAISGQHVTRVPDLFTDGPRYVLSAEEKKTFKEQFDRAVASAREIKAAYPKAHLRLGNGTLAMKEELYRAKFPAALFDSAGNEAPSFGRPPEAQPPDCVAHNASIWMDRQLLDAYGYKDRPVSLCYETCYPATNPGNLSLTDQADYLVRHGLHSLAWNMPEIKLGQISDMGNGYYFSNWGAIGFCRSKPELNVKPAFVAVATMTRVLDGAKFVRVVPLGSESLYGMEFQRPDGERVHALWALRGKRPVTLRFDAPGPWTRTDDQGNDSLVGVKGTVEVALTPSPVYLIGKGTIRRATAGQPVYTERPAGKGTVLAALDRLDGWVLEKERDPELEYYDFMCPRRKGDFGFEVVAAEGKERVLKVTPRRIKHGKETMPMYAVLAHGKGIKVPGTPTEIGAWVNGNSGWGRLIFELQDASGQRWVSLGAQQDVPAKWVAERVPKEQLARWAKPGFNDWNTSDVFGLSRINFDGWRWVGFPLPGNYPGERYPWPANSQWRWDKDGVVHYPLTFRRLIVELPEKVLHVRTFAPPARPEVYLKDLSVGQDDRQLGHVPGPDR